tara:strand:- start:43 stop:837 length:795 start_codon:yes stop_codon:yes gene_type:complete
MTKDTKKDVKITDNEINDKILNSLKANEPMKKILFKVSNLSNGLMKLVPEMAVLVNEMIAELDSKQKGKIKGQIDMAFLKAHLYSLSQYKRKTAINSAYEMAVTRAVKLGILMNTDKEQFSVNDKNEVLVMDKIATPMIDQFKKGQKGGSTKIANDSEQLVPVHTGLVDKLWSTKFAVATRTPSTKDTVRNLKAISNELLTELNKAYNLANKKDHAKLLEMVDEKVIENLGNIKALLEDNSIRTEWTKANDLMANDVSGNLKTA